LTLAFACKFSSQIAQYNALDEARAAAAAQARSASAPVPLRAFLADCSQEGSKQLRRAEEIGYWPWPWEVFSPADPGAVDALSRLVLAECAERFVLEGDTLDEMLTRADLASPFLSDRFQDSVAVGMRDRAE
jgi:hypothetical protein